MIITAKILSENINFKNKSNIKSKIKSMEEKSKNKKINDNKIENINKKENENVISELQFMKNNYSFEIEEKKEIKIAIEGKEMNDANLKFQPANINDIIFEKAFNQILIKKVIYKLINL